MFSLESYQFPLGWHAGILPKWSVKVQQLHNNLNLNSEVLMT